LGDRLQWLYCCHGGLCTAVDPGDGGALGADGKISRMQVTTVILVTLFGGLSVWLNDERFFKMKPTAIYLLFAVLLAIGLARGQSYLKYVMEEMMPLNDAGWMILTKRLMLCFFGLALANELNLAFHQHRDMGLFQNLRADGRRCLWFFHDARAVVSDLRSGEGRKLKKGPAPAAPNGAAPRDFLPFGRRLARHPAVVVDESGRGA